jgi:hypothetical protein
VGIIDVTAALGRPFVLEETIIDLAVRLVEDQGEIRRADTLRVGVVDLLGRQVPEIRVGTDTDAHSLICIVSDVILGASGTSARIADLTGIPRV